MNVKNETPAGELSDEQIVQFWRNVQDAGFSMSGLPSVRFARAVIAADRTLRSVASAPTGWQLVPVEPTHEILTAMLESEGRDGLDKFPSLCYLLDFSGSDEARTVVAAAYRAMLAAAPKPPAAVVPAGDVVMTMKPQLEGEIKLVRQVDAQAALAAKDAAHAKQANASAALIKSLESRITTLQAGCTEQQEAVKTLQSERDANAVLTGELAAKDADYAHGVALLNMRIKDLTAERDALVAQAKPDAQAVPVLLTDEQIKDAVCGESVSFWNSHAIWIVAISREVEAAVHAANQALGSEGGAA